MKIYFRNKQSKTPINWQSVKQLARFVLKYQKISSVEVGLLFVDNSYIARLNRKYFKRQGPTDVIAFPMNEGRKAECSPQLLGDIVISIEKAVEYSEEHNKDLYMEISLYLIHGILHLLGYDDIIAEDRKEMMKQQRKLLNRAKRNGLLITAE